MNGNGADRTEEYQRTLQLLDGARRLYRNKMSREAQVRAAPAAAPRPPPCQPSAPPTSDNAAACNAATRRTSCSRSSARGHRPRLPCSSSTSRRRPSHAQPPAFPRADSESAQRLGGRAQSQGGPLFELHLIPVGAQSDDWVTSREFITTAALNSAGRAYSEEERKRAVRPEQALEELEKKLKSFVHEDGRLARTAGAALHSSRAR